jgi:hypothetical protein
MVLPNSLRQSFQLAVFNFQNEDDGNQLNWLTDPQPVNLCRITESITSNQEADYVSSGNFC